MADYGSDSSDHSQPDRRERFWKEFNILGVIQIVSGLAAASFGSAILAYALLHKDTKCKEYYEDKFAKICAGLWCGIFLCATGVVSVITKKKKTNKWVIATLVTSVVSFGAGVACVVVAFFGVFKAARSYSKKSDCRQQWVVPIGLYAALAIVGCAGTVTAVLQFIYSRAVVICCSDGEERQPLLGEDLSHHTADEQHVPRFAEPDQDPSSSHTSKQVGQLQAYLKSEAEIESTPVIPSYLTDKLACEYSMVNLKIELNSPTINCEGNLCFERQPKTSRKYVNITLQNLFSPRVFGTSLSNKELLQQNRIVVMIGPNGSGKTSYIKHLLKQSRVSKDYDYVFFLQCRHIDFKAKSNLLQLLVTTLPFQWINDETACVNVLKKISSSHRTLLLIDDYNRPSLTLQKEVESVEEEAFADAFIQSILGGRILSNAKVLVATRTQNFCDFQPNLKKCSKIIISGLDFEAQNKLCKAICKDNVKKVKKVLSYIKKFPFLDAFCVFPENCSAVMHIVNTFMNQPQSTSSSDLPISRVVIAVYAILLHSKNLRVNGPAFQRLALKAWKQLDQESDQFNFSDKEETNFKKVPKNLNVSAPETHSSSMFKDECQTTKKSVTDNERFPIKKEDKKMSIASGSLSSSPFSHKIFKFSDEANLEKLRSKKQVKTNNKGEQRSSMIADSFTFDLCDFEPFSFLVNSVSERNNQVFVESFHILWFEILAAFHWSFFTQKNSFDTFLQRSKDNHAQQISEALVEMHMWELSDRITRRYLKKLHPSCQMSTEKEKLLEVHVKQKGSFDTNTSDAISHLQKEKIKQSRENAKTLLQDRKLSETDQGIKPASHVLKNQKPGSSKNS